MLLWKGNCLRRSQKQLSPDLQSKMNIDMRKGESEGDKGKRVEEEKD